jgi:hypothetical protein
MIDFKRLKDNSSWGYENQFYWYSDVSRLGKILAHYELYKSIVNLPGDVIELGVFKGTSLIRFAAIRRFLENDSSRKIIGFDTYGKFPSDGVSLKEDREFIKYFEESSGVGVGMDEFQELLCLKGLTNIELVGGNVFNSIDRYLATYPATRISLLNVDLDVAEPVSYSLDKLWDRIVPGGLVLFDDYGSVLGETTVVDQFLVGKRIHLEKLSFHKSPAYLRKT